jgi:hypothetical protein
MADDTINKLKEENDNLEQELMNQKFKGLKGQLVALGDTLHGRINDLEKKNDIQFEHLKGTLETISNISNQTLDQARKTNGRVTHLEAEKLPEKIKAIEKDTRLVRFMHKYPRITVVMGVVLYLTTIKEVRDVVGRAVGTAFEWIKVLI